MVRPSRLHGQARRLHHKLTLRQPLQLNDLKRDYPQLVEAIRGEQAAEVGRLQQEVERLTALEAAQQKRRLANRLFCEFHLPDPEAAEPWAKAVVSRPFLELLMAASDEPAMRVLVEERRGWCVRWPARRQRIARPKRGRDRAISTSSTPPER